MLADLRYAARQFARSPAFTIIAVLTLAFGIGANVAAFSVAEGVFHRPVPAVNAERLVWIAPHWVGAWGVRPISYPELVSYRDDARVFEAVAGFEDAQLSLSSRTGEPERVAAQIVSGNYFAVLGAWMAIGRGFLPDEDRSMRAAPVAVISHRLWQRRFHGDSAILGTTIRLNRTDFTVVGVAAEGFNGLTHRPWRDVWIPLRMVGVVFPYQEEHFDAPTTRWLEAVARLRPGVATEAASLATAAVAASMLQRDTMGMAGKGSARVIPVRGGAPPSLRPVSPVMALAAMVTSLILFVACANVGGMLLGRAVARQHEIAVRLALGAGRWRLVRQLLVESLVLATVAAAGGTLMAYLVSAALARITGVPLELALSPALIGFVVLVSVVTAVLFGLAPALSATRPRLAQEIRTAGTGLDAGRSRLQRTFVVAQLALSMVLLVTTLVFLEGTYTRMRHDPGIDASASVLRASFDLGMNRYSIERAESFAAALEARVRTIPGVDAVTFADPAPYSWEPRGVEIEVDGVRGSGHPGLLPEGVFMAFRYSVAPGYFGVARTPLLRGRDFAANDDRRAQLVAIVSMRFAETVWPDADPIGKRFRLVANRRMEYTIIGIVANAATVSPFNDQRPEVYFAQGQEYQAGGMSVLIRTDGDAARLGPELRRIIRDLDADLPVFAVNTLDRARRAMEADGWFMSVILGLFALIATGLSALGVYAVTAFAVLQRTRDVGIRVAVGALPRQIVRVFVRSGVKLGAIGIVVGLLLSAAAIRVVSALVFGSLAPNPLIIAVPIGILAAASALASWYPARWAARLDAVTALRSE